ncbi:MAG TPA: DUF3631 domain-containing protein [Chthoniobacterales bacterium]|jgi:putative DNA primase/helicase|nr:DUF3631 domain-containing protein [Chthoniobacterales bacterium]
MSHEESFRAALRESGIEYSGPIYIDDKLHRIKADGDHSKNSWYVLYPGSPVAGVYGCWKRDLKKKWCERNGNLSQGEWIEVRRRWQDAKRQHERTKTERQKKARRTAAWILGRAKQVTTHTYLNAKQVQSHGDLRGYRGALVLPLRDINGELHSLQFIGGDGSKNFLSGGRVAGCLFTLADKADGPVVIGEGYATGASIHEVTDHSVICCINCGNLLDVAKAVRELWPRREIIIAADDDQFTDGNPGLTQATAAAKAIRARLAVPQFKEAATRPTDFNDLHHLEGASAVKDQIEAATTRIETDDEAIGRLAALSRIEFDRCVQDESDALGISVTTLRKEVEQRRAIGRDNYAQQGQRVELADVELWEHEVNGADLLNEIAETVSKYVVLPSGAADVIALWIAHTHTFKSFLHTPRLNIQSPEKRCGKTTLRDVLATLVPKPLATENLSTAVLFRVVDKYQPTLLVDECDSWIHDNEDLRGLLNAGHKRGGQALRCVGDDFEPRAFNVFAPVALAGIGNLPGTLHDRSIIIKLVRAKPGEVKAGFDARRTQSETQLCRKLARWCADNRTRFESCDPKLPDDAFNRVADNWRPLFAIAEIAGGDWPKRAAEAFAKLIGTDDLDAHGIGTRLLADIATIFTEKGADRIASADLTEALTAIEGRPWAEWGKHRKPISPNQLANLLRPFGVSPHTIRISDETPRGYLLADFGEAFERFLPKPPVPQCNSTTMLGEPRVFVPQQLESALHPKKPPLTRECCGVALYKEGMPEVVDPDKAAMPCHAEAEEALEI